MLYFLYRLAERIINPMPIKSAYRLVCALADIKYYTSVKDKQILIRNMKAALGKTDAEARIITRNIFRNFCKYLVDFLRQDRLNAANIKDLVRFEGLEHLDAAFKKGKGVILLSAHIGNWELGSVAVALAGYPLNIVALTHKDKRVNNFFNNRRGAKGIKVIQLGGGVKKIFSALERNEAIALLADRDFSKSDLVANFFGKPTAIPKGAGVFNIRKGAAIVPCFVIRQPDDTYTFTFEKAVEFTPAGHEAQDIQDVTQESLKIIEEYIKRYPDQWLTFGELWPEKKT